MSSTPNHLKYSVALGTGRRGAGLGNEIIALAKSYLAAEELGLDLQRPRWLSNRYGLPGALGWSRRSLLADQIESGWQSTHLLTEGAYRATGEVEYGLAVRKASKMGLIPDRARVLTHAGMWGGYAAIRGARPYLRQLLASAPGVNAGLGRWAPSAATPVVAVHVRAGDFTSQSPGPGQFNAVVPVDWYVKAMEALRIQLEENVTFLICTNGTGKSLEPILGVPGAELVSGIGKSAAIQELMILAAADALICSVSSFSMLAAFLSEKPYIWYQPQLTHRGSRLTLWGGETEQQRPDSISSRHLQYRSNAPGRGRAWSPGRRFDPVLISLLRHSAMEREQASDLLYFGNVAELEWDGIS